MRKRGLSGRWSTRLLSIALCVGSIFGIIGCESTPNSTEPIDIGDIPEHWLVDEEVGQICAYAATLQLTLAWSSFDESVAACARAKEYYEAALARASYACQFASRCSRLSGNAKANCFNTADSMLRQAQRLQELADRENSVCELITDTNGTIEDIFEEIRPDLFGPSTVVDTPVVEQSSLHDGIIAFLNPIVLSSEFQSRRDLVAEYPGAVFVGEISHSSLTTSVFAVGYGPDALNHGKLELRGAGAAGLELGLSHHLYDPAWDEISVDYDLADSNHRAALCRIIKRFNALGDVSGTDFEFCELSSEVVTNPSNEIATTH